jgi:hypothetical protein
VPATAQRAAQAPASSPPAPFDAAAADSLLAADRLFAAADDAGRTLDALRPVRESAGPRVADLLSRGLAAIDEADTLAAERLDALAPDSKPMRGTVDARLAAEVLRLRALRCRAAVAGGDLLLRAAAALPAGHPQRQVYIEKAGAAFQTLRVEYHDLAPSLMGYLGESRALRMAGDATAARAALATVLGLPDDARQPLVAELKRAALVEDLEAERLIDPKAAAARAARLGAEPPLRGQSAWLARVDYVVARALADQAQAMPADGPDASRRRELVAQAAALARSGAVAKAVPPAERLEALVRMEALAGQPLLSRDELLAWADLLASAGDGAAVALYDRARAMSAEPLGPRQLLAYVALAMNQKRYLDVANTCDRLLESLPADDARRGDALQWRAAALVHLWRTASQEQRSALGAGRVLKALEDVVAGAAPAEVRRDALRQWASVRAEREGLAACLPVLDAQPDLVDADAWLLYTRSAARAQRLTEDLADAAVGASSAPGAAAAGDSAARSRAVAVAADLARAGDLAAAASDKPLAARAALLRARVLARPPASDAREAYAVLEAADTASADSATAGEAAWLRVELLLDLGLVDEAARALERVPEGAASGSPLARLRLAEGLAARYAAIAAGGRAEVQRRAIALADAALVQVVADDAAFASAARRAARVLLAVEAYADARRVLEKLIATRAARADAALALEAALMQAEALRLSRDAGAAAAMLERVAAEHPRSVDVHLARARCLMDLARPADAAEACRAARGHAAAGSAPWCRATLALAEALAADRHAGDAADILRVSAALYPDFGDAQLLAALRRLRERLARETR